MYKNNSFPTFFGICVLLATGMSACTDHLDPDTALPSHQISQSEQLAIPAAIQLPANAPYGNSRVGTYYAVGVQKYKAREKAGSNPVTYEWVFVEPEADLFDATSSKVGTHFAGPSWKIYGTNDWIQGQAYSPAKIASLDPASIDWLLLAPKSGTTPTGIFQDVDYIQRIATEGGKAPATLPFTAHETMEVPYRAVYRFSKLNP